ncbi:MAG: amidase [Alphaproteobacteria bacterium]|nr:amidase [Alphaproteobacteria bacterium]
MPGTDLPTSITAMDGIQLGRALREKRVSCAEVMEATLNRIDWLNPKVNAIVSLQDRGQLLAQARERDAMLMRGEVMGPLHGFPQAVKDLDSTKGIPTTKGSPLFQDFVPDVDSIMVERLRKAGAIVIGKTNVPEFGLGSHTRNPVFGPSRNPYDLTRTPGGSSGGAAAALALRLLPVADGSDYGGSLRNPAGWNNVFGFRPSTGRIPADDTDLFLPSMGTAGPMARTVPDLAMLLSVQAGYDQRAPLSIAADPLAFAGSLDRDFKGTRIAFLGDFEGYLPYEAGVLEVCRKAMKTFEDLGCVVEEAIPDYPVDKVWKAWLVLRAWQAGGSGKPFYDDPAQRRHLNAQMIFEVESGMKLSAYDVTAAGQVRSEWYRSVLRFFRRYDFFVLPTAQVFPFPVETVWPTEIAGRKMTTYHEWMKVVLPVTMSGCPALAVPAGFSEGGLPMGLQIVGPNHAELACLQIAHAYDRATNWVAKRPPPMAA